MKETDWPRISVTFSEETIDVQFRSDREGEDGWDKQIKWADIFRISYKTYDCGAPDFVYIHLDEGFDAEAIVPMTETGGEGLWKEIQARGLVSENEALIAQRSENEITSWPKRV